MLNINKIALQPGCILHTRDYRDTSLLLELLTQDYGRVSLVARGVRNRKSKGKGTLQPFIPLLCSWSGRGELMTLTHAEAQGIAYRLQGDNLLSAFYINELLVKVLHRFDPHPKLYEIYVKALTQLAGEQLLEKTLRIFEKHLLAELGYKLTLNYDAKSGQPIEADQYYHFDPGHGVILLPVMNKTESSPYTFYGQSLLAFHEETFVNPEHLRDAKRLMRIALTPLLNSKSLKSRELFTSIH